MNNKRFLGHSFKKFGKWSKGNRMGSLIFACLKGWPKRSRGRKKTTKTKRTSRRWVMVFQSRIPEVHFEAWLSAVQSLKIIADIFDSGYEVGWRWLMTRLINVITHIKTRRWENLLLVCKKIYLNPWMYVFVRNQGDELLKHNLGVVYCDFFE